MAVTLQLARIPAEYLAACRNTASTSPSRDHHWEPPACDALDLDWAPVPLARLSEAAGLDEVHLGALRRATAGDTTLDLGFLNTGPHAIAPFGPDPTALSVSQVARVCELLGQIDISALLAALPIDDLEAGSVIGYGADQFTGGPREYLLTHFSALRDFYTDAARRHLLVVLWWG
ncbi:DUF1877 family protein [Streptomyces melanogenes]|uniref:DUF1877 family protein n=1 Tax=Streptomyces melanogenes TaxID=67326 RepID=UPI00167DEC37|nr:DUF1877 family protein [Streptomyces melanogenes]